MRLFIAAFATIALCLVLATGCGKDAPSAPAQPSANVPVRLALNWFPEAEHGGFYAADVHGYYREAGLDVTIVPGGPGAPVVQQVATGEMEFGVVNADNLLFARAKGADVTAVMAALQDSPRCLIVHESSGITTFEEIQDVTLAMSPGAAFAEYLKHKVPLTGVKIVPYSGNVAQFLADPNFAQQGYSFSEPFVAKKEGGDPRVLMLSDLGFNPYTSLLIASASQIRDRPDVVRRMVEASVRGWQKYLEAPDETNRRIHELNAEMPPDVLAFGAEALRPLVLGQGDAAGIGRMTSERWQALVDQLVESGQLEPDTVRAEEAFTTQFLQE